MKNMSEIKRIAKTAAIATYKAIIRQAQLNEAAKTIRDATGIEPSQNGSVFSISVSDNDFQNVYGLVLSYRSILRDQGVTQVIVSSPSQRQTISCE